MCARACVRLQKRQVLEEAEMLDPRISALEEDLDEVESSEDEDEEEEKVKSLYLTFWDHNLNNNRQKSQIWSYTCVVVS